MLSYDDKVGLSSRQGILLILPKDLLAAIEHIRHGNQVAQAHRKKAGSYMSRFAGYMAGSDSSGVGFIKGMTMDERHAELTYAESLFEKVAALVVFLIRLS